MSTSIEALIPELQAPCRELLAIAGAAGVQPRITSTLRSHSEQARLYRRFVNGKSKYPAAPPGSSAHEFGYAFDMVVVGDENQDDLGQVWGSWGGVWGPNDPIHFEYPGFSPPRTVARPEGGSLLLTLADIWYGSAIAEVLSLFLPKNAVLDALSSPITTVDPYVQQIIHWAEDAGILIKPSQRR